MAGAVAALLGGATAATADAVRPGAFAVAELLLRRTLPDDLDGLSFRATPTARLKIAGRMDDSLLLTPSGRKRRLDPAEPVCVIGRSGGEPHVEDLRSFAESRLRRNSQVTDIRNFDGGPIEVRGREGYELLADARDLKSRLQLRVYQAIVPDGGGYLMVNGVVGAASAARLVPEFRLITQSLRTTAE